MIGLSLGITDLIVLSSGGGSIPPTRSDITWGDGEDVTWGDGTQAEWSAS